MITYYKFAVLLVSCLAIAQGERLSRKKCSEYREQTAQIKNPELTAQALLSCSQTVNIIAGGELAKSGEFPHQAVLGWRSETNPDKFDFHCGGSLISERYILTAAHCLVAGSPDVVRLGVLNLNNDNDNQVDYEVEESIRHPEHRFSKSYNDIALIKLAEDVPFNLFVRPACLWDTYDMNVTEVIGTGFGFIDRLEPTEKLMKFQLDFLPRNECAEQYANKHKFKRGFIEEQLCIGSVREGRETCLGDSGSPIQVITEPEGCMFQVLGLVSAGTSCGDGRSPTIYTRVAGYIDWIESIVWK